ncbi:conserved hypothetical protein [Ricinus communis]|uniref:Uncharacterized protein n=1 Tax=Ricinus communis TaxID=3988 RepID=B9SSA6_RICCO|nr:conserved hypothetical protein [Ricinus communis]
MCNPVMAKDISLSQEEYGFANRVGELFENQSEEMYRAFLHEWKLYEQGHKGKHDLYCEIAFLFCDNQEFVVELARFLRDYSIV